MNRGLTLLAGSLLALSSADAQRGRIEGALVSRGAPLENAVAYLVAPPGDPPLRPLPARAMIDQRELRFIPAIVSITPGSAVEFPNSDDVLHNVFHPGHGAHAFDLGTYSSAETRSITFTREGAYVILCNVHPEMAAFVHVAASPHRAVSDTAGHFVMADVPPGRYQLHVWHRRARPVARIVHVGGDSTARVALRLEPIRRGRGAPPVAVIR